MNILVEIGKDYFYTRNPSKIRYLLNILVWYVGSRFTQFNFFYNLHVILTILHFALSVYTTKCILKHRRGISYSRWVAAMLAYSRFINSISASYICVYMNNRNIIAFSLLNLLFGEVYIYFLLINPIQFILSTLLVFF